MDVNFRYFVKKRVSRQGDCDQWNCQDITDTPYLISQVPQLPHSLRGCAICMINGKMSARAVTRTINVNTSTISSIRRWFEECGTTANRPHARWPLVTTPAEDRYIRILHLRDRLRSATATIDETVGLFNRRISPQTVRNGLREASTWIGPHPCPTTTATRMAQEAHPLDTSTMEQCPLQWWITFSASQSRRVATRVTLHRGAECWCHRCTQGGTS